MLLYTTTQLLKNPKIRKRKNETILCKVSICRTKSQRKNATFTFHSGKSSTLHAKILPVHSEGHCLINKALLSIMAYDREKHITFSGHYTTLSCTVAVLPHL